MILRSSEKSPEKIVAAAMALITLGLSLIVIGVVWPRISFLAGLNRPISNDFLHGFVFGLAIALELTGVAIAARVAAFNRKKL